MISEDELLQLRKEQRERLLRDISDLKVSTATIQEDIHKIREQFAKSHTVEGLDSRVRDLENYRAKIFGMFIASQILGGIIVTVIGWLFHLPATLLK